MSGLSPEERLAVDMALSGLEGTLYGAFWRMQEAYGLATAMERFRGFIDANHWDRVSEILKKHGVRRQRARGWPEPWMRSFPESLYREKIRRRQETEAVHEAASKFFRTAAFAGWNPLWTPPGKRKLILLELADRGAFKGPAKRGTKPKLFGALFKKAEFGPEEVRSAVEILPQVSGTEIDGQKLRVHAKPDANIDHLVERIRRIPGIRLVPVEVLEAGTGEPEIYRRADYPRNPTPFGGPGFGRMPFYYPLYDYVTPSVQGPSDVQKYRQDRPHEPRRTM